MDDGQLDEAAATLDRIRALHVRKATVEALIATEVARYAALTAPTEDDVRAAGGQVPDSGENDLAARMGWPAAHAAQTMTDCTALVETAPATFAALTRGDTDWVRATAVARAIVVLSPDDAVAVDAAVAPFVGQDTLRQLTKRLAAEVQAVDDEASTRRNSEGRRRRGTWVRHLPDGLAELVAVGPAPDVVAASEGLRRRARRAARVPGETRTETQLRFDLLVADAVAHEGSASPAVRPLVSVTVALSTLLGADDRPGHLDQHGPIPADLARDVARQPGARLRRLVTDPLTGVLISVDDHTHPGLDPTDPDPEIDRRFPSPRVQRAVRQRDTTCTVPWCSTSSTHCDLDHAVPWPRGRTCWCDLHPLCRRHHRMKQAHGWSVHRALDGTTTWTTPTGHRITRALEPVLPSPRCSVPRRAAVGHLTPPDHDEHRAPDPSDPAVTDAEWRAYLGDPSWLPPDPQERPRFVRALDDADLDALRAHVRATAAVPGPRLPDRHGETPPF